MSKRGPEGQGDKLKGLVGPAYDPDDTPVKANAAQLAARKIASAKVRRGGGGGNRANLFSSQNSSAFQALGNPFANPVNGTNSQNSNMSNSGFGQQQQSGFNFGSSQSFPPINNNIMFGSTTTNSSFPPPPSTPQTSSQSGNNLFGSVASPSGGFAFTAIPNNPFSKPGATSQPSFTNSVFGSPTGTNNNFGGFGQHNASSTPQQQLHTSPGNDSMQISPPVTPHRETASTPARSSIFSTIMGGPQDQPTSNFFPQLQKQNMQQSPFPSAPSHTAAQAPSNAFTTSSTPHMDPPKFNFGQMQSKPAESSSQLATPGQNASVFGPFANIGQPFGSKATELLQYSANTPANDSFGSAPFASFGKSVIMSNAQPQSALPSSSLFQIGAPATSQSPVESSINAFKPSTPAIALTPAESPGKNIFGNSKTPTESTSTLASNPFVNLDVPSTVPSSAAPSLNFNFKGVASATSSLNPFSMPPLPFANSANPVSSIFVELDPLSSKSLTEGQKEVYKFHLKLRSLNDGFRRTIGMLALGFDWSDITRAYILQYEKTLDPNSHALTGVGEGGKRKAVDDLPADKSKKPNSSKNRSQAFSPNPSNGTSQTANLFRNIADYKSLTQESSTRNPITKVPCAPTFGGTGSTYIGVSPWGTSITSSIVPSSNPIGATSTSYPLASKSLNNDTLEANMFAAKSSGNDATHKINVSSSQASTGAAPSKSFGTITAQNHSVKATDSKVASSNSFTDIKFSNENIPTSSTPGPGPSNSFVNISSVAPSSGPVSSQFSNKPASEGLPPVSGSLLTFKVPSFGNLSGALNFMTQFGKQAEKDAVKAAAEAKRKRKAENFDSDEDDEEEWERKDAEEQRAKKARVDEEARGNKLKFIPGEGFAIDQEKAAIGTVHGTTKSGINGGVFMPQHSGEAQKPVVSNNRFAHLASASNNSSQSGDAENDDAYVHSGEEHEDQSKTFAKPTTGPFDGATDESSDEDESLEEAIRRTTKSKEALPAKPESNNTGQSLFDRVTFPDKVTNEKDAAEVEANGTNNTSNTPSQTTRNASSFEQSSLGITSPAGDQTWKADSPIKFSASNAPAFKVMPATPTKSSGIPKFDSTAPPSARPFAGLFGNITPSSTPSLFSQGSTTPTSSPAMPTSSAFGFNFGGPPSTNGQTSSSSTFPPAALQDASARSTVMTSRATTPGADSGTEAAEGDAKEPLDQKDLTNLTAQELCEEEVLFDIGPSRFLQHNNQEKKWIGQGTGPLRVLKNKETGVVRIVCRIRPSGRVVVNTRLLKGVEYKDMDKNLVQFMVADGDGKLATWMVKLGDAEDCTKLVEVLTNYRPG